MAHTAKAPHDPDRALAAAILLRALKDAQGNEADAESKRQAEAWLDGDGPGLALIAGVLEMDEEEITRRWRTLPRVGRTRGQPCKS